MAAGAGTTYKIIKVELKLGSEETLVTTVTYDINAYLKTVEVEHFMPQTLAEELCVTSCWTEQSA